MRHWWGYYVRAVLWVLVRWKLCSVRWKIQWIISLDYTRMLIQDFYAFEISMTHMLILRTRFCNIIIMHMQASDSFAQNNKFMSRFVTIHQYQKNTKIWGCYSTLACFLKFHIIILENYTLLDLPLHTYLCLNYIFAHWIYSHIQLKLYLIEAPTSNRSLFLTTYRFL